MRDEITGKTTIRAISKRGERMGDIGRAPLKPQSAIAQLTEDLRNAERLYGVESPDARAIRQKIEQSGQKEVKLSDVATVRKEFLTESKDFVQVRDGFRRVMSAKPTPAGDMALVFGYMKLLDPGSAVRETEYANAENARGVADWVRNLYNKTVDVWRSGGSELGRYVPDAQAARGLPGAVWRPLDAAARLAPATRRAVPRHSAP